VKTGERLAGASAGAAYSNGHALLTQPMTHSVVRSRARGNRYVKCAEKFNGLHLQVAYPDTGMFERPAPGWLPRQQLQVMYALSSRGVCASTYHRREGRLRLV
jgi:hypothetical protein